MPRLKSFQRGQSLKSMHILAIFHKSGSPDEQVIGMCVQIIGFLEPYRLITIGPYKSRSDAMFYCVMDFLVCRRI